MDAGYTEWAPPAALRGVVSCLWARIHPDGKAQDHLVLPDACSDLIWEQGTGVYVAGPDTSAVPGTTLPGTMMFGVRFWPWAGGPALGLPLSELCDQRVGLAELRPADAKRLPGTLTPEQIIADVKTGLYVTETMGHGVNLVTGDYSHGASGLWIENGEIAYPVEEITIAGNLKDMYKNIVAIGNDLVFHGASAAPTLRIEGMTIAGS